MGRPDDEAVGQRGGKVESARWRSSKTPPGRRAGTMGCPVRWTVGDRPHAGTSGTVHGALAPRHAGATAESVSGHQVRRRRRSGRSDVAAVRGKPGGQPPRRARATAARGVAGEAVSTSLHPEDGRAATAARRGGARGQDRPAGRDGSAQRHLRGGLPRLFVRVSAGAQPARSAGCPRGRDPYEEGSRNFSSHPWSMAS